MYVFVSQFQDNLLMIITEICLNYCVTVVQLIHKIKRGETIQSLP